MRCAIAIHATMASSSSSSNNTALTKRPATDDNASALMPPPAQPPTKRIKRPPKVLDEDTYTAALDHIIARDFFPGLLESRAQAEFLDALDSADAGWINDAAQRLTHVMTPGPDGRRRFGRRGVGLETPRAGGDQTPTVWGGETPMSRQGGRGGQEEETGDERRARAEADRRREEVRGMSLNAFQAKYTSEDNESFNRLLDDQNRKRAEKYRFLWAGNKIASGRQIAFREREQKLLQAEAEGGRGGRIRNNDRALVRRDPETERDADARKAMPDHRPAAPKNAFMFPPDSVEDALVTVAQAAQDASTAPPRAIVYNNTRLPAGSDPHGSVPPASPSLSAVDDAIRGRPRPAASEAAYAGSETPRVNGYAFVDEDEPEPEPEPAVDSSLLQRLGVTADAGPNPFTIKQASRREELHHRLVDKSAKAKRGEVAGAGAGGGRLAALRGEGTAGSGKTPTPKFASSPVVASRRGGNLTPAAQRLFAKVGTPRRAEGEFGAFGDASPMRSGVEREKVRWTPTPRVKRAG